MRCFTGFVTVAVRRVNVTDRSKESLLDFIDPAKYALLPNTDVRRLTCIVST